MSSKKFFTKCYHPTLCNKLQLLKHAQCYEEIEHNQVVYIKIHGFDNLDVDIICSIIRTTPTLKTLDLQCSFLDKVGIFKLYAEILLNKTIKRLYLADCLYQLNTKEIQNIFDDLLSKNTTLRDLRLCHGMAQDKYTTQLCDEYIERNHQWKYTKIDVHNIVVALHFLPIYILIDIAELILHRQGKPVYATHYQIAQHVIHLHDFITKNLRNRRNCY